jgi:hypothetical protein
VRVGGVPLPPGRHVVGKILAVVGRRSGPRLVVGGEGALAAAVFRRVWRALEPDALEGSVVLAPGAAPVRVRTAAVPTVPHLRLDLRDARAARRGRRFGTSVVVDDPRAAGIIYEASADLAGVEVGTAGLLALATGRAEPPPPTRVVSSGVRRLKARVSGELVLLHAPGTVVRAGAPLFEIWRGAKAAVVMATRRCVVLSAAGAVERGGLAARVVGVSRVERGVPRLTVGWCERVALPDLGIAGIPAKIDTGAQTAALHAAFRIAGAEVELGHARVPLLGWVTVRDSGGHAERRPVIETTLVLGPLVRRVRITLTHRGDMRFPMLVGRSALGPGVTVDPRRKNLL